MHACLFCNKKFATQTGLIVHHNANKFHMELSMQARSHKRGHPDETWEEAMRAVLPLKPAGNSGDQSSVVSPPKRSHHGPPHGNVMTVQDHVKAAYEKLIDEIQRDEEELQRLHDIEVGLADKRRLAESIYKLAFGVAAQPAAATQPELASWGKPA